MCDLALYQGTTFSRAAAVSTFSESKAHDLSRKSCLPLCFCFVSGHDFSRAAAVSTFSESKAYDLSRKSSLPLCFCFVSGHDFSRAVKAGK
jgi:hypothetical protein